MTFLRSMLPPFALLLVACEGVVVSGGSGDPGAGGAGGASVVSAASGGEPQAAVARTRTQLDILWDEYWQQNSGSSSALVTTTGTGPVLDPNDLFVDISDLGVTCGEPYVELPCGVHWSLSIWIPPALQQVGIYDWWETDLRVSTSETGPDGGEYEGDCSKGSGPVGPGTVEILAIDDEEIQLRVTMGQTLFGSDPSGDYTAPRCE